MSIDLIGGPVNSKQLVDAGMRCGIEVTKDENNPQCRYFGRNYIMTWDLGDYEEYAQGLSERTRKAFYERIAPVRGRFVMVRTFVLDEMGYFHYSVGSADDCGIADRLIDEVGLSLSCCEYDGVDYEQREYESSEQDDIGEAIRIEHLIPIEPSTFPWKWDRYGYEIPQEDMEQHEIGLQVELDHCIEPKDI